MVSMSSSDLSSVKQKHLIRPWSVDSLNGGATDVTEKPPIEKKVGTHFFLVWPPDCIYSTNCCNASLDLFCEEFPIKLHFVDGPLQAGAFTKSIAWCNRDKDSATCFCMMWFI